MRSRLIVGLRLRNEWRFWVSRIPISHSLKSYDDPCFELVRVDTLPVVDMLSPEEDHIWGALDEGCNSTCHSKAWGELAEDRLRVFGLTFPWIDGSTKSFAGLGSSTKTLGKRNLPFCIQVGEDSLAGAMESYEIDTSAFNPLLVSFLLRQS